MPILSPKLLASRVALNLEFQDARPFRHVVIPEFFDVEFCQGLLEDFPPFEAERAINEMGQQGRKAVWTQLWEISPRYWELDKYIKSSAFLEMMSAITGISNLLYDSDYVGGGTHENRDGQSLSPHIDFNYLPRTGWHRRLNLIVYLNKEWDESWGGNLEFHSNPWSAAHNTKKSIQPRFNCGVIFETTERSWHGFSGISLPSRKKELSRKSIAIYLYTKERPAAETEASHGTIYVLDGMPPGLQPGSVLTDEAFSDLNERFSNLRGQLQFLYRRELQFSRQVDALSQTLDQVQSRSTLPIQGYLTQNQPTQGYWPDGWASNKLSFSFRATRPSKQLGLQIWVPEHIPKEQRVSLEINGRRTFLNLDRGRQHKLYLALEAAAEDEIQVSLISRETWTPARDGNSTDERALAFQVIEVWLEH